MCRKSTVTVVLSELPGFDSIHFLFRQEECGSKFGLYTILNEIMNELRFGLRSIWFVNQISGTVIVIVIVIVSGMVMQFVVAYVLYTYHTGWCVLM